LSFPATETIVAIATPPGTGAIAIVRCSGPGVPALARRLLATKAPLRSRVATRATLLDELGEPVDEALAILFPAPSSYTGEDMLEVHVHGSPIVARETVRAILACGARLAQPGEFTRRAFFNGKMDLHAAAAVADVVAAETRAGARAALANLGGGLSDEVEAIRRTLTGLLEELSAAIDFPDEVADPDREALEAALEALVARLARLRRDGELGRLVREGVAVAIVGPPNAGKSSLLNALLGEARAIVSELPGTTRDTIEESVTIDGVPVRIVDTAGIRSHAGTLEAAGIERTRRALQAAAIVLLVIDGSAEIGPDALDVLELTNGRERIVLLNKADLGTSPSARRQAPTAIVGSVRDAATLEAIRRAIADLGWGGQRFDLARPHLRALHEFDAVNAAIDALQNACGTLRSREPVDFVAVDLRRAFSALGHVTDQVAAEEIIDGIFSRFCIGK